LFRIEARVLKYS